MTRRRIIQAARLVFSERGYDGATFRAIAARAELTRPAINHYFSSKRVLYRDVMDDTNEAVIGTGIKQAEDEITLAARLAAFLSAAGKANSENPAAVPFLIRGVLEAQRHPDWIGAGNDSVRIAHGFLTRVVNDAIGRGEALVDIDASTLVEALLVVVCGMGLYAGYVDSYKQMPAVIDIVRQFLEGGALGT